MPTQDSVSLCCIRMTGQKSPCVKFVLYVQDFSSNVELNNFCSVALPPFQGFTLKQPINM